MFHQVGEHNYTPTLSHVSPPKCYMKVCSHNKDATQHKDNSKHMASRCLKVERSRALNILSRGELLIL